MIATQIFIFTVILISSVHFITCPATGGATKPNVKQFAAVDDVPVDPTTVEKELNQPDPVKSSVPTKIHHVVSKSFGLFVWPFKKSWKLIKDLTSSVTSKYLCKQTPTKKEIKVQ